MMMMTVLFKSCGNSLIIRNNNLNDPAEPPKSSILDSLNLRNISSSGANFLVYVFFLVNYFELFAEAIAADRFLITQAQVAQRAKAFIK